MNQVDAIYRDGVFQPLEPISLAENQCVRLRIESSPQLTMAQWLERASAHQQAIFERVGLLPDSTPDIAADRLR